MVFGIKVRFLFMLVTANLKASSSTLMGSFSRVSKMPPARRKKWKEFYPAHIKAVAEKLSINWLLSV